MYVAPVVSSGEPPDGTAGRASLRAIRGTCSLRALDQAQPTELAAIVTTAQ